MTAWRWLAGCDVVYVRDSKAAGSGGPVLRIGRAEWAAFVGRAER
ncbi:hypothetical protein SALBM135S_03649 [Streptomyces alboniger]